MVQLVITSFARKSHAMKFARRLVEVKLAACCTILPGAASVFEWKGKRQTAGEVLLLIKTLPSKTKALEKFFKENHPYELPEFLILNADASKNFWDWLAKAVR
jgi:periplasmic divalent cation tolerance protein